MRSERGRESLIANDKEEERKGPRSKTKKLTRPITIARRHVGVASSLSRKSCQVAEQVVEAGAIRHQWQHVGVMGARGG
jgi:hypothetical protein